MVVKSEFSLICVIFSSSIVNLRYGKAEALVSFLPLILDKLLLLMVKPIVLSGDCQPLKVSQMAFEGLVSIVHCVSVGPIFFLLHLLLVHATFYNIVLYCTHCYDLLDLVICVNFCRYGLMLFINLSTPERST